MTVQEMMRVLVELPHDTEVIVAVAEIEERFLRIAELDADLYNRHLIVVLEPKETGYDA